MFIFIYKIQELPKPCEDLKISLSEILSFESRKQETNVKSNSSKKSLDNLSNGSNDISNDKKESNGNSKRKRDNSSSNQNVTLKENISQPLKKKPNKSKDDRIKELEKDARKLKHIGNDSKNKEEKSELYFQSSLIYFEIGWLREESDEIKKAMIIYRDTISLVNYIRITYKSLKKQELVDLTNCCIYYFTSRLLKLDPKTQSIIRDIEASKFDASRDKDMMLTIRDLTFNYESREKLRKSGLLSDFELDCMHLEVLDFIRYLKHKKNEITTKN